ncbi:MAG: (2Fe-2S)-binding protein [Burkholderiales bacterium]|nr:(2Fe-2S)-binding protein [Burkholderiales bacterium]
MDIKVNGVNREFKGDPNTPLLWVLRDHLNITSLKFGCGQGLCGACSAHVDGKLTRTCVTACDELEGKNLTTLEGLAPRLSQALKSAWIQVDVPQCGYCQTGMIMAAAALLDKNPKPSDEEITAAMNKNICRCGTYSRIRRAIHIAAKELA